jgi:peptidoglycan/LPS O-acetylase OafA/YrhL
VKHYAHIDGLRALAVLPVILFHFNLAGITGGYVGVDVFFVISGFLITGVLFDMLQRGKFSLVYFYERRARRILPALFVTSLLCLFGCLLVFVPDDYVHFSRSLEGVAGFASNFVFARWVGYFEPSATVKPLLHTWSLAVEEQFYLLFPLLLWGLDRAFAQRRRTFTLCLYAVLAVSLALNCALISVSPERSFYLLHTRAWELMAGAVLMLHLQKIPLTRPLREALGLFGLAALAACLFLYDRNTVFPGFNAVPPVLAAMALIWSGLGAPTWTSRLLAAKPLAAVGLVSYGLYLYHWPVLVFARYSLDRDPGPMMTIACLAVIAALSVLSWRYVETSVRSGRALRKRKKVFIYAGLGLAAFGLIGLAGVRAEGFPGRFSGPALQYAAGMRDKAENTGEALPISILETPVDTSAAVAGELGLKGKSPKFLLWGDSHAAAISPALDLLAKRAGISGRTLYYSGCPALLDAERADGFVRYSCRDLGGAALRLLEREKIKHVLLVARWEMYSLGWEKGGIETTREPLLAYTDENGTKLTGREAFAAAFRHTIQVLNKRGIDVWVLRQVPPQLVHVPSALAKAVTFGRDPDALRRPYADVAARLGFINAVIDSTAETAPLHAIDPAEIFCPKKTPCLIAADGHALYSDNSHLTITGALWSKGMFAPFFRALANPPQRGDSSAKPARKANP